MPGPPIATARLQLRPFSTSDLEALHRLWTDPAVRRYLFDDQIISRARAEAEIAASDDLFHTRGLGMWSVRSREERALIGFCGFKLIGEPPEPQLMYGTTPSHWKRGLTSEAARAVIRFGFEQTGLDRIVASADAPNTASVRVMEKAGMTFQKRATVHGLDLVYYELRREAFRPDDSEYMCER